MHLPRTIPSRLSPHAWHRPFSPLARQGVPAVAALFLAACASVPQGDAPPNGGLGVLPAGQVLGAATTSAPANWPGDGWWHSYGDAQLAALVDEGLAHSPNVAAAAARLRKAAAMAGVAGAARLPTLNANGTVGETRQSLNMGFPPQFQPYLPHGWFNTGNLGLNFGFDPDLWGKNRAMLAAALSERQAATIDAQAARLALASAIAGAYVALAGDIAAQQQRAEALANRQTTEHLVAQRMQQGLENRASLDTAEGNTATARADLAAAEAAVALARDQIAALMGAGPDRGLAITAPALPPLGTTALPADVSTDLLGRRPDIAAARARAEAARAGVRAAHADFFPSLRLSALIGFQSLGLSELLAGSSTMGSVGPAVSLPIFHGGAIRSAYRGAQADADAAIADYNRAVVGAYQQLADAVTLRAQLLRQRQEAATAVTANEGAYALIKARYTNGLDNYLAVLGAEDRLLAARAALTATDSAARQADIALIRALGGGYADAPTGKAAGFADATTPDTPSPQGHDHDR